MAARLVPCVEHCRDQGCVAYRYQLHLVGGHRCLRQRAGRRHGVGRQGLRGRAGRRHGVGHQCLHGRGGRRHGVGHQGLPERGGRRHGVGRRGLRGRAGHRHGVGHRGHDDRFPACQSGGRLEPNGVEPWPHSLPLSHWYRLPPSTKASRRA